MGKAVWITLALIIVALAAVGAYWFVQETLISPNQDVPGLTQQISNPASVFCGTLGGTVEIRRSFRGEVGVCNLPDGKKCEEWALYQRNECVAP